MDSSFIKLFIMGCILIFISLVIVETIIPYFYKKYKREKENKLTFCSKCQHMLLEWYMDKGEEECLATEISHKMKNTYLRQKVKIKYALCKDQNINNHCPKYKSNSFIIRLLTWLTENEVR